MLKCDNSSLEMLNILSLAAVSEGTSPARPAMTLAAAKQWRASMYRVYKTSAKQQTEVIRKLVFKR